MEEISNPAHMQNIVLLCSILLAAIDAALLIVYLFGGKKTMDK